MNLFGGVFLLARFRPEGFAAFQATPQGFVNSLTPMLAIALVVAVRPLVTGSPRSAVIQILSALVALLAPAAITHLLARAWGREARWLRTAVAFNWCQTAITFITALLLLAIVRGGAGGSEDASMTLILAVLIYWIALCWFLLRRGLDISGGKAALAVLALNFGTGALVLAPTLIAASLR